MNKTISVDPIYERRLCDNCANLAIYKVSVKHNETYCCNKCFVGE